MRTFCITEMWHDPLLLILLILLTLPTLLLSISFFVFHPPPRCAQDSTPCGSPSTSPRRWTRHRCRKSKHTSTRYRLTVRSLIFSAHFTGWKTKHSHWEVSIFRVLVGKRNVQITDITPLLARCGHVIAPVSLWSPRFVPHCRWSCSHLYVRNDAQEGG